ncbi:Uncharacterised protein [Myroides odoratus]|uniref:Uncharacterized protein n=1 Tax=Myroides odoratus TaxID=256 RepID=A0A378RKX6_MYROD|nr:Uncharacterised protein [Myroides odoratus]
MPLKFGLFSFYDAKSRKDCELLNPIPELLGPKVRNLKNERRKTPTKYTEYWNEANNEENIQ